MAVQKILSQQIANTGGVAGQVLVANSTGVTWGDANNTAFLGGVAAASYVNTAGAYTITGIHTYNANLVIGATGEIVFNTNAGISANGSFGTAGQALTTNGSTVYWSTIVGTNTAASYSWTNTHTFNSNVTLATTAALIANGLSGTAGQTLTSNGTTVYWSSPSVSFANGQSISVTNLTITGGLTANSSTGAAGQILTSNGTTSYWANSGAAASTAVRQSYTGDGTTTSFTVSGGYTAGQVSVFLNGVMLRNGTEVTVTSGTAVVFGSAPPTGALIDVIGSLTVVPTGITAGKAITLALIFGG
jgi:hypothetical protein